MIVAIRKVTVFSGGNQKGARHCISMPYDIVRRSKYYRIFVSDNETAYLRFFETLPSGRFRLITKYPNDVLGKVFYRKISKVKHKKIYARYYISLPPSWAADAQYIIIKQEDENYVLQKANQEAVDLLKRLTPTDKEITRQEIREFVPVPEWIHQGDEFLKTAQITKSELTWFYKEIVAMLLRAKKVTPEELGIDWQLANKLIQEEEVLS